MLGRSTRPASWSGVAHPVLVGGGRRDRGADLAGCGNERGIGAAGWAGELAPAFGQTAPGNLVGLQRRRQPLDQTRDRCGPFVAAASVTMLVVLVMSAWTRATRTRSAGSGLAARVRCA